MAGAIAAGGATQIAHMREELNSSSGSTHPPSTKAPPATLGGGNWQAKENRACDVREPQERTDLSQVVPIGGDDAEPERSPFASHRSADEVMNFTWRQQFYLFLEDPDYSMFSRVFSHFILYTIVASIACFVLETMPQFRGATVFKIVEPVTTIIFTLEYLSRFFVCDAFPPKCYGHTSKWGFIKNPLNILDLLAILPYWLEVAAEELMKNVKPLRVLRSVRLIRCFRIFKLSKYSLGMTIMVESVLNSVQPLSILTFFLCIGVVLTSSLMYYAERTGCPDVAAKIAAGTFAKYQQECADLDTGWTSGVSGPAELCCNEYGSALDFQSVAQSFWWSVVTMTTVGYGDHVPRTLLGRLVGCLAMISGIILISLPVAIVGSKFQMAYEAMEMEELEREEREAEEKREAERLLKEAEIANSLLTDPAAQELADAMSGVPGDLPPIPKKDKEKEKDKELEQPSPVKEKSTVSTVPRLPDMPKDLPGDKGITRDASTIKGAPMDLDKTAALGPDALSQFAKLRVKLKHLEKLGTLNDKATEELFLLLEMFDHVERVDKQLDILKKEDALLDITVRKEFATISRAYDGLIREGMIKA